jgi:hypothetical protein
VNFLTKRMHDRGDSNRLWTMRGRAEANGIWFGYIEYSSPADIYVQ